MHCCNGKHGTNIRIERCRTCFMSCPVTAVIWEPNMEARVTCDARDRAETPDRADRALARENTDPAADARLPVPSRTVLRSGSQHRVR